MDVVKPEPRNQLVPEQPSSNRSEDSGKQDSVSKQDSVKQEKVVEQEEEQQKNEQNRGRDKVLPVKVRRCAMPRALTNVQCSD